MVKTKLFSFAAVALGALCCAQGALAASWSSQKLAIPQGPTGSFASVSCAVGGCIGVGSAVDPTGHGVPLAQKWTGGTTWGALTPNNPTGANATLLNSVSCTAVSATSSTCTALGYSAGGSSQGAFSESINGSSWSPPAFVPHTLSGQLPDLSAISCFGAGSCVAVGNVSTGSPSPPYTVPAVSILASGGWTSIALGNPTAGSYGNYLTGVSCPTSSSCMAVGYSSTGPDDVPFTEQLSKSSAGVWSAKSKPTSLPSGDPTGFLNSVSCTAANACVAVEYAYGGTGPTSRANYSIAWGGAGSGTAWSAPLLVNAPGSFSFTQLSSISCVKATSAACVAVGSGEAHQLSGTTWTQLAPPSLGFRSVSCTATSACTAVGGSSSLFGFATTNRSQAGTAATAGSDGPPAAPVGPAASFAAAQKAAQTAPTQSAAQGDAAAPPHPSTTTTAAGTTAAARWSGGAGTAAWSTQSTLSPTGALGAYVQRVSCAGGKCLAIGSEYPGASLAQPLAEAGPGTWTIQDGIGTTPDSFFSSLSDVSCVAASPTVTQCVVVGSLDTPTHSGAFSQRVTSGSSWSAATPAYLQLPPGANWMYVNGVSCTTPSSCDAVGDYYNSALSQEQPLVEHWDGTGWKIRPIQSPSTTQSVILSGVSCVVTQSVTGCSAVGTETSSTYVRTAVAESWNGSKYVPQTINLPSGTTASSLGGVSCPAAYVCTGIGTASGGSFYGPLAERLSSGTPTGSWSSQGFSPGTYTYLNGISCATKSSCTAVGGNNALQWTTSGWGNPVMLLPPDGEGFYASLGGVSCSSASSCTAAGSGYLAVSVPLAEILS